MINPFSSIVLGASAIVASPALYNSFVTSTLPMEVGITRFFIAFGICWVAISLLTEFALSSTDETALATGPASALPAGPPPADPIAESAEEQTDGDAIPSAAPAVTASADAGQ